MIELLCPGCMEVESYFTQYRPQPASITVSNGGMIVDSSVDTVEIDEAVVLRCDVCGHETLPRMLRATAEEYLDREEDEEEYPDSVTEEEEYDEQPTPTTSPSPPSLRNHWEQVAPVREK